MYGQTHIKLATLVCRCQILHELQLMCKKMRAFQATFQTVVFRRVCKIAKSNYHLRHVCLSVRLSARNNSALTRQIFIKFYVWVFFENMSQNSTFIKIWQEQRPLHMKTNKHFVSHLAHFFSDWKMFQTNFAEKIETQISSSMTFLENRAVYKITWKNTVESRRPCIACCIPKATNTISEYVTSIAFLLQQWLHERASFLRYRYNACLVLMLSYPLARHIDFYRMNEHDCIMFAACFLPLQAHSPPTIRMYIQWMNGLFGSSFSKPILSFYWRSGFGFTTANIKCLLWLRRHFATTKNASLRSGQNV